jgi:hypothetical protein
MAPIRIKSKKQSSLCIHNTLCNSKGDIRKWNVLDEIQSRMLLLTSRICIEEITSFEDGFARRDTYIVSRRCYFRCYKTSAIEISAEVKMRNFCFQSTDAFIKHKSLLIIGRLKKWKNRHCRFRDICCCCCVSCTACPSKKYWLSLMFLKIQSIIYIYSFANRFLI